MAAESSDQLGRQPSYALLFAILAFATTTFFALESAPNLYEGAKRGFGVCVVALFVYVCWRLLIGLKLRLNDPVPYLAATLALGFGITAIVARPSPAPSVNRFVRITRTLESLQAGVNVLEYERKLGNPLITHERSDLFELFFVHPTYIVQAVIDLGSEVLLFSVTTRDSRVRPTFRYCSTRVERPIVTLGETRFRDVSTDALYGIHYFVTNGGTAYSELYGGLTACNREHHVLTYNERVSQATLAVSGGLQSMATQFGALVVAGSAFQPLVDPSGESAAYESPVLLAESTVIEGRRDLPIDTYSETVPDVDFFQTYPEFFSFREELDFGPALRDLLAASPPRQR